MGGGGGGAVGGTRSACVCVGEGGEEELATRFLCTHYTKLGYYSYAHITLNWATTTKIWYSTKMGVI